MTRSDVELAIHAAHSAGAELVERYHSRDGLDVSTKRAGDFVSNADIQAEQTLREILLGARPGDGWLGEESGETIGQARRWIVDPLDGTTNFLRGIPHWAVSIALEDAGELTIGVVHDPLKGETFAAWGGGGLTLNGEPAQSSSTASLDNAVFGTGIPFGQMAHIDDHAADLTRLMPRCAGVRRMGVASLDLAYVACGRLDGFWERRLRYWDIAAGLVLVREAGLEVEGWAPGERPEDTGSVITAIPSLFSAFSGLVRGG